MHQSQNKSITNAITFIMWIEHFVAHWTEPMQIGLRVPLFDYSCQCPCAWFSDNELRVSHSMCVYFCLFSLQHLDFSAQLNGYQLIGVYVFAQKTPFVLAIIKLPFCNSTTINRAQSYCSRRIHKINIKKEVTNTFPKSYYVLRFYKIDRNKITHTYTSIQPCSGSMYDLTPNIT